MPQEFLKEHREPVPDWLERFVSSDTFSREDFFNSRVVFYPGSGSDGQPVRLFAASHSAHCFVYADCFLSIEELENELELQGFLGYHILATQNLQKCDLAPHGVMFRNTSSEEDSVYKRSGMSSYRLVVILERDEELNDDHGAVRIALLFLGADGFATYDVLFCQARPNPPYVVIVQDHGYGRNYERFDKGGLLERIARRCDVFPEWLLVAEGSSEAWEGYTRVAGIPGVLGGMHRQLRCLYQRYEE